MSTGLALALSAAIIALSAFFVAAEFGLVAARRHRIAEAAPTSASARAALRSAREMSLLLAAAQLGITLCTVALGAITKPAVHDLLLPLVGATGLPEPAVEAVSFVLALAVVTFVHLVVGEMAPKSWAITAPERSAMLLAIPIRVFIAATRPLLVLLNGMANRCLRRFGVTPVDEVSSGLTPGELRVLVEHSTRTGALDARRGAALGAALDLHSQPLRDHARPRNTMVTVQRGSGVETIRRTATDSGHLRLVVCDGDDPIGVVHVRDALAAPAASTAAELMRPVAQVSADSPLHVAISTMRRDRSHLALVRDGDEVVGMVTLSDMLELLPLRSTRRG
ncbi:CNNM domain-containing protein [Pseudonocardia spinosispora]|uniref:CNNM domain-containing protein n=1 Tax=Pseudonocardia spinosispora TaxID=103441 RepID=UPI00041C310C|nr:hemolysin family protein [Pseudonocardia spinosispora]